MDNKTLYVLIVAFGMFIVVALFFWQLYSVRNKK